MTLKNLVAMALVSAAVAIPIVPAWAGAKDYAFEPVKIEGREVNIETGAITIS